MLHVTLTVKHGPKDESLERLLEKEQQRIVARLNGEPLENASLHCEVDRNTHRKEGYASLTLDLPGGAINAHGKGRSHLVALRHAADALLVELERRREHRRERERESAALRPVNGRAEALLSRLGGDSVAGGGVDREMTERIEATLPELETFVRTELARHAQVFGASDGPRIDLQDVVEEAFLRALATREQRPAGVPFDRYLFSCAYDVLLAEEERLAGLRGSVSLEADVDAGSAQDGGESDGLIDAEIFADLVPDSRSRGGDVELLARDFRFAVMQAIRHLPADKRRVLSLVALEGLAPREAARRLHCPESGIAALMEEARDAVRRELLGYGY